MIKTELLRSTVLGSTAALAILLSATPALAQSTPAPEDTQTSGDGSASSDGTITITGSRIRRPNEVSSVPVTSVTAAELQNTGDISIGDALNDLPSLRSTYSQANSTRFIGTTGLNLLDLRGLGISRTLVLVNGRRHVTASVGDFLVDVNTIPSDLIERVDVITGGSSAVYGSDAVAGVVNFVLKNKFSGVALRAQSGISEAGDRGIRFVSGTFGKNFADGRGNIAINLEYAQADPLYFIQRNSFGAYGRCQFNLAEPTTGEPQSGDGVPDQQYFCGVRNGSISTGGTVLAANPIIAYRDRTGPGGIPDGVINALDNETVACTLAQLAPAAAFAAIGAARCINAGSSLGVQRIFRFDSNGFLGQDIPALNFGPFGSGNIIDDPATGFPGSTLRETGQLAPGLKRFTANLLAHFDIAEAFKPFIEAKYVRLRAVQEGQPSFFSPVSGTIGLPNQRCDNAFLTPQNVAQLQAVGYCATPASTIPVARFNYDFGGRRELIERDTYRFVAGVRGTFNTDWNYELSATYGKVRLHQDELNDLRIADINGNLDGFSLAYQSTLVNGVPTCNINIPVVTRPDCVPLNVFGYGRPSQAALNFIQTTSFIDAEATQFDIVGYINGDLSQLFEFPGGPVRFVIGGEYRRETAFLEADPLSAAGGTFFNAFSTFAPPAFDVKEVFGEIEIPLLKDVPFFKELSLTGAARYSDYNTSANTTFAWNLGATWSPIRDLRFRANYSKSVRVPTISDLFSNPSQNFAFIADPCDVLNINNGTTNRAANCAAAGIPAGFVNATARAQSTGFFSAGNPNLTPETSKSLTVGAVFTPSFVKGLSVSVDYYRIRVNNLIAVLGAQVILNQCFDLPQPNQFCSLLNPRLPNNEFANPALISAGVNFAQFKADGVDVELNYNRKWGDFRFDFRAIATYVIRRDNFTSPTTPTFRDRILGELGDPQVTANVGFGIGYKAFSMRWTTNFIGKQTIGAYENYFPLDGRPPQNADVTAEIWYPDTFLHNVKFDVEVNKKFTFYVGMDNIFNTPPPFGLVGNEGGNPYDSIGRYMYAGVKLNF